MKFKSTLIFKPISDISSDYISNGVNNFFVIECNIGLVLKYISDKQGLQINYPKSGIYYNTITAVTMNNKLIYFPKGQKESPSVDKQSYTLKHP